MVETNAADTPIFRALLTPHRSLTPRGFQVLMGIMVAASLICGLFCIAIGAWPIFGFFGLDVLILYVAFKLNYRSGRAREEVSVSRTSLDIRQIAPSGRAREHHFNPFWARFAVARHEEIGITRMAVEAQGQQVQIGSFLNPDDRESFAKAFGRALATARAG